MTPESAEHQATRARRTTGLPGEFDEDTLRKYFTLSDADLLEIQQCRGTVNRVGFAIQLCCLRWFGYFLSNLTSVPESVTANICSQLQIQEPVDLSQYPQSRNTLTDHPDRIRAYLRFNKCDERQRLRLLNHLTAQAAKVPRSTLLNNDACDWLRQEKIVRPAETTLREIIATAREAALQQVFATVAGDLTIEQQKQIDALLEVAADDQAGQSKFESYKRLARRESADAIVEMTRRLMELRSLGLTNIPGLQRIQPTMSGLLASWGYRYDAWSIKRFAALKRYSIVVAFLKAALAETTDAIVEMQDKLITRLHNKARERREALLRAAEKARSRAVDVLEQLGGFILDESIADADLRSTIFSHLPLDELEELVLDCHALRLGDGSHLGFLSHWYSTTRRYSPDLLLSMPFEFVNEPSLQEAVSYLKESNQAQRRRLDSGAPTAFLSKRWEKHVVSLEDGKKKLSKPDYELAVLSTLNEKIKSGDVTVIGSRRWSSFEDYLIPSETWEQSRAEHYQRLGLPVDVDVFIEQLGQTLTSTTMEIDRQTATNEALSIDAAKGTYTLARLKKTDEDERVAELETLIQSRLPKSL